MNHSQDHTIFRFAAGNKRKSDETKLDQTENISLREVSRQTVLEAKNLKNCQSIAGAHKSV